MRPIETFSLSSSIHRNVSECILSSFYWKTRHISSI